MLPLMMLHPTDLGTFTTEPNSAELLPQDALEPTVAFADILQVGLQPLVPTGADSGRPLPLAGNGLPPVAAAEQGMAGPAHERTLPMPAVEQVSIEGRAVAGLDAGRTAALRESPLSALSTATPGEQAPRAPASPQPVQVQAAQPLPAGNRSQQQGADQATVVRAATDGERISPEPTPRPQPTPETYMPRPAQDTAAAAHTAIAKASLAEAPLGRRHGPGQSAERLLAAVGNGDSRPAPLLRDVGLQPGVTREIRQAVPVGPGGQPAQIPVDSLNQAESPLPQGPGSAQSPQAAPTQLAQAAVPLSATANAASASHAQAAIDVPVRDSAWSGMLGERVLVMANNQLQNAEIRLTPAELGPLRIQVAVEDGAANVTFHAQHAVTREAIEQALPRLRELLAENGLTLNQADVGEQAGPDVQQGNREAAGDGAPGDAVFAEADEEAAAESAQARQQSRSRADGLVDTFA